MQAAAHGHSTLGIPQKVAREFVAADKKLGKSFKATSGKGKGKRKS